MRSGVGHNNASALLCVIPLRDELTSPTPFEDVGGDAFGVKAMKNVLFRLRGVGNEGVLHTEALDRALERKPLIVCEFNYC